MKKNSLPYTGTGSLEVSALVRTRSRLLILFALSILGLFFLFAGSAQDKPKGGSPNDFRKTNRGGPEEQGANMKRPGDVRMGLRTISFPSEFRTITGYGNNSKNPDWGAADIPFLRRTTVDYGDGVDSPSGADRPGAREISNAVAAQTGEGAEERRVSDFVWQWGQFLDHDITLTPTNDLIEPFNIPIPQGDPFFDPRGTGQEEMGLDRSFSEVVNGIREQVNEITAFVDASNVYGSEQERADALRTNDGTGRLAVSDGDLLPFNTAGLPNAPSANAPNFFLAGDFRANEQVGLTAMHTIFVREHNYWADYVARSNSSLSGDQIYEIARVLVGAEMQAITYNEFLPVLLGPDAIPKYRGYEADLNPGITNVFATASYRFGHSMLSSQLLRLDRRMKEIREGHLDLASAFFDPTRITEEGGIDPILRGLSFQRAQRIDTELVDDVRNFLFGPPGAGGFDLASLNIQRGRDHGLPGYNEVRRNFGLRPVRSFRDITPNREVREKLESVYDSVEDIDIWVGGLAEPPFRGGLVGETVHVILRDQFLRLRDGDRFWYERHLDESLQSMIEKQTLARIIERNTRIRSELTDNPWIASDRPVRMTGGPRGKGGGPGGPRGGRP